MENIDKIKNAYKAYKRGGDYIYKVFHGEKSNLTAEDCMYLFNTYGIHVHNVVLMAISHGFSVDDEGFAKLLDAQEEKIKNMKQCNKDNENN